MPWTLDNAAERAAEAPRSFFIPPAGVRNDLRIGDAVKLLFRLEHDLDGSTGVERMWVEVVAVDPYVGTLLNAPKLEGVIQPGQRVLFGPEHVCAYADDESGFGYDLEASCLLLKRVAHADEPPALLLLDPDGEWQAHADPETDAEVQDAENVLNWTLGYLTDRFPQTTDALREGADGTARDVWWRWDGSKYVRDPQPDAERPPDR